jgi:CubicO group peptidase (beta-lactamase class C family)
MHAHHSIARKDLGAARPRAVIGALLAIVAMTACGSDPDDGAATPATSNTSRPAEVADTTSTEPAATQPTTTTTPATTTATTGNTTTATIEQMLAASLTDIPWNCCGANGPPTGAAIAIRSPGAEDLLISTGSEPGGAPFEPTAPFHASNIAAGLVQSVAHLLIDSGQLDPAATIDMWAPQMPDAATVTLQMLLDNSTGWGDSNDAGTENVLADLSRVWTLAEVVDVVAGLQPTGGTGREIDTTVLGYILEQTTGSPVADLVEQYITAPLGLNGTTIDIAAPKQPGYQNGVFVLDGTRIDTGSIPTDAYFSFYGAANSATSTLPDLLDLLDAWVTGDLLGPDRAATPDKFQSDDPDATFISGDAIPVNGYCDPRSGDELEYPCTPSEEGLNVMAIGRQPNAPGTTLVLWHFPATGISIAMHHNSNEWTTLDPLQELAIEIHDLIEVAK